MGLYNQFPWTNFHEMNLDWLLMKVRYLEDIVETQGELLDDLLPDAFIINADLGSSNESGGSATVDCTYDKLKVAIESGKRPVINAHFVGSPYEDRLITCYVDTNLSNKVILSWVEGSWDFTYASGNHSTCKLCCKFLTIEKSGTSTIVNYVTMNPTIGG